MRRPMTAEEARAELAAKHQINVSAHTMYRWLREGRITKTIAWPTGKGNNFRYMIDPRDLRAFAKSYRRVGAPRPA